MAAMFFMERLVVIDRDSGDPMIWQPDHRIWSRGERAITSAVTEWVTNIGAEDRQHYSLGHCDAVAKMVIRTADQKAIGTGGSEFNAISQVLGLPHGKVADLHTGEIRDAKANDFVTRRTAVMPKDQPIERFREFLWDVCCARDDLYQYLWALMGYTAYGTGEEEIAVLLRGEGADGKGTLIGALQDMLGAHSTLLQPDFFKATAERRHMTELAELHRKRLWANPESADGRWIVQRFKTMTGEKYLMANRMRQDPTRVALNGVLWIGVNKIPLLDGGRAMQRRLRVIPCNMRLQDDEIDPALKNKTLPAEYPGILHRIIANAAAYRADGLPPTPQIIDDESAEFLAYAAKPLDTWLEENVVLEPTASEPYGDIYTDAVRWHESAGHKPPTKTAVGRFLKEQGLVRKRSAGFTTWNGLRLDR